MIFFFVVGIMAVAAFAISGFEFQKRLKAAPAAPVLKAKTELSWPSKQLLKEYNALPVENRPFDNITAMLVALDVKHGGIKKVDAHYYTGYSYSGHKWDACNKCRYPSVYGRCGQYIAYTSLRKTINEVAEAVAAQKQALEIAKVQPDLDDIKTLTERMRAEKEIITQVTKELF